MADIAASEIVIPSEELLTSLASVPVLCNHKDFSINFEMGKNAGGYVARVRLWCSACGQPFFFSGVGSEPSDTKPHAEMDGTQVHLPIGAYYGQPTDVA